MEECSPSLYATTNTSLAAYLKSLGFEIVEVDNNNPRKRSVFKFLYTPELSEAAQEYELGTANGNVPNFFYEYKKLVSKVKDKER